MAGLKIETSKAGPSPKRRGDEYKEGELETILSLVPSRRNIANLARLLDRSEDAICLVFQMAYTSFGKLRGKSGDVQRTKILEAKAVLGIDFGPKR